MTKKTPLLAIVALLVATLACNAIIPSTPSPTSVSNARVAFDQNGDSPTTVFAPSDDFYIVFDLNNGKVNDSMSVKWYGEETEGEGATYKFYEQSYAIDAAVPSTQTIYFQLYNTEGDWPVGPYKVEIYLNDELDRTLEFQVQ